jgi:tripartite-type tricarboxylate transporter receptor subunit TctC
MTPSLNVHAAALACLALLATGASAQSVPWPQRTVRIILPTPPGSPADVIVRLLQPKLQDTWGQSVIVENKSGAGGNIAMQEVLRTTDSHTIFAGPDTVMTINPHLYKKLPFRYETDVVPVTYMASFSQMLVCNPQAGLGNLGALVKAGKAGPITYASSGAGSPSHMTMEMLVKATGMQMTHVPYRGPAPAALDVVGGQVQCGFLASTVVLPFVKQGKLVPMAVSGAQRTTQAPDIPTVGEDLVQGFNATFFETLQMARTTPKDVIDRVHRDVQKALMTPEMTARLIELDVRGLALPPAESERRRQLAYVEWGSIAKGLNLSLD